MAIYGSDQISIVDVTDAYSVILTSDAYTFPGTINAAKAGNTTTQIIAMRGADQLACSVVLNEVTKPAGVTVTSNNDATSPTLTIAVSSSVTSAGTVVIPVHVGDIVIEKEFSFAIAFTGATGATGATGKGVKSTAVTYQSSSNGTAIPTGTWSDSIPAVSAGHYLWTRTIITYTDNTTSTSYSVGMMGVTGDKGDKGDKGDTGKGVKSTAVTYQVGSSATTAPTGTWSSSPVATSPGQYLWTKTVITYTDGTTSTSYSVSAHGATGAKGDKGDTGNAGADAITLSVTSSNGLIFKNTSIATTLTAHVYKAGVELTEEQINALGTIKWYKDGGSAAVATGINHTIDAGDVANKATFIAQLEG